MRVALDCSSLNRPMGGYERYARSLVTALAELPDAPELLVLTERRFGPRVIATRPGVTVEPIATLPKFMLKVMLQDQLLLPRRLRAADVDVVHTPMFAGLARAPRPYVLTLHDLIPLEQPEAISRSAAWYWRRVLPRAVRRADRIITDSEHSRRRIRARFGLPAERVVTVPLAVDAAFQRIDDPERLAAVRARYRLPPSFLLFVGMPSPRKNLPRLVAAFARLPPTVRGETRLVLAGPPGWRNRALAAALDASGLADRLHWTGLVDDADLPAVYSLAEAAVSVSLQEGFALPALEALACETPLVCSDTTAYPELVGNCAVRVDPEDVAAIADGLAQVLAGDGALDERRAAGAARAARYRWQATAAATAAVYRAVAPRP